MEYIHKFGWWYFRKFQAKRKFPQKNQSTRVFEMSSKEKQELIDEKIRFDTNFND